MENEILVERAVGTNEEKRKASDLLIIALLSQDLPSHIAV